MSDGPFKPGEIEKRDRGVLTHADREFLVGHRSDMKPQSKREARKRIRDRLENAIYDLGLISYHLEERDRKRVAESVFTDRGSSQSLSLVIGLIFDMLLDKYDDNEVAVDELSSAVRSEVQKRLDYRTDDEYLVDVSGEIYHTIDTPDVEYLKRKYENKDETLEEFLYLERNGHISSGNTNRWLEHLYNDGKVVQVSFDGERKELDPSEIMSFEEFREMHEEELAKLEEDSPSDSGEEETE